MTIALRTANQTALDLVIEVFRTAKPALEFVIIVAAEVVNDHLFNCGAGTGVSNKTPSRLRCN